jgi:hypothetical protein
MSELVLPVALRALGDEVRALKRYVSLGLLTQDEASERLDDWQLSYPPGWFDVEALISIRSPGTALDIPASKFAKAAFTAGAAE